MIRYALWDVLVTKRTLKRIAKAPETVQFLFDDLAQELRKLGPIRANWPNYSKLGSETYHCHLKRSWVVCWRNQRDSPEIEVYYAGSREDAPY